MFFTVFEELDIEDVKVGEIFLFLYNHSPFCVSGIFLVRCLGKGESLKMISFLGYYGMSVKMLKLFLKYFCRFFIFFFR